MKAHLVPIDTENDASEPDVWWGEDGIDARLWADPKPYTIPERVPNERAELVTVGDAR